MKMLLRGAVLLLIAALVCLGYLASHYRVYSLAGLNSYSAMAKECPAAWREFHFRRFRAGADIEEVIRVTKPLHVERHRDWVTLQYQAPGSSSGITAHAHHGQLVLAYAWSCAWIRLFVDDLSEGESQELMGVSKRDPRRFGIVPVYR
ncbi:hypothetical protein [Anatilimnocola floriformis]|uniref:hypothetical protein n=1 Tax=Anatilimnocola floriformis TaxID=2948575 RepID=UPI0020C38892|nr:hypothetical protein [Anatilimnocola floriformis]